MTPASTTSFALPRIGLLGNPSDGYRGKVLACTFSDFRARVTIRHGAPPDEPIPLLRAAGAMFERHAHTHGLDLRDRLSELQVDFDSDIPRQVGLAGSSAIITAAIRAFARCFGVSIPPSELAELSLAAETEILGIAAGPQDRVIQAHGGLLHMDFTGPRGPERYTPIAAELPPLFLAWQPATGESSDAVHSDLGARFREGDERVCRAMRRFAAIADAGATALVAGDTATFRALVDENFDLRASICEIGETNRELIQIGRTRGAAVKFCGSGGAVFGVPRAPSDLPDIARAYRAAGFATLQPTISTDRKRENESDHPGSRLRDTALPSDADASQAAS